MYKLLTADGSSCNGGSAKWHLPTQNEDGSWAPGAWMPPIEDPKLCSRGYHLLCSLWDILNWEGEALFAAEGRGAEERDPSKVAVEEARLPRLITATLHQSLALFSADCSERVLHLYETAYPNDMLPRRTIDAARAWALNPTDENAAAWASIWDIAWAAGGERATWGTWGAWVVGVSARGTAWAARDAVGYAAGAAGAAGYAAGDAAWDAAWAAAGAAELEWQKRHLAELLGEVPA